MLSQQLARLRGCRSVDSIVVATTTNAADDAVVALARLEGLSWFRGSEDDVLSRMLGAAVQEQAEIVVRVTADCPLIDPTLIDAVIHVLTEHRAACDYVSNVQERTYPRGLDVEAFFMDTLQRFDRLAVTPRSREHVTTVLREEYPELFLTRSVKDREDNSDLRWTVDTETDLKLVRYLYDELGLANNRLGYEAILAYIRQHPELERLNAGIETWDPVKT